MATYRQVHISFWQDPYIEELSPKEKYFYLYLMTNSKTKQCGCYEISMKLIRYETGLTQQEIDSYIAKLVEGEKIGYNKDNQEFLLINWLKHNSFKSTKVLICIKNELATLKTKQFIAYIESFLEGKPSIDRLSIDYTKTMGSGLKEEKEKEKEEEEEKEKEQEVKKQKKMKNEKEYSDFPELNKAILDFVAFRKSIKKPMTDHAVDLFVEKLSKMSNSHLEQIEIINQSIMNGWSSVYELKNKSNNKGFDDTDNIFLKIGREEGIL